MNTKIIYEVNENWAGIAKGESAKIIGTFDNFTLIEFIEAHEWAIVENAVFNDKLKKVTFKPAKKCNCFLQVFDRCECIRNAF